MEALRRRPLNYTSNKRFIWIVGLATLFTLVFCAGFVFFYTRRTRALTSGSATQSDKPLPSYTLIDQAHQVMSSSQLRDGKVILVFVTPDCDACLRESQFLQ